MEYKDMLKALRMWDEPKQYWLQDVLGRIYNVNKFYYIHITKFETAIKAMDKNHEEYLREQGLI